ncbi:hypothetical protein B0H65DRAFT_445982 [Neurospora tetraspora]|uniref:Uncharacterized protein n=1 Tax=Neurospora tetraspora TaxID=94610 RepID=A0AAE0J886_9PEZI|nr:hypothetical protein B0H65DRAFT_445982 [Neurospora tetraspora]
MSCVREDSLSLRSGRFIVCLSVCLSGCYDTTSPSARLNFIFMASQAPPETKALEVSSRVSSWCKDCDVCRMCIPGEGLTKRSGVTRERDLEDLYKSAADGCLTCKIIGDAFESLLNYETFRFRPRTMNIYLLNLNDELRSMYVYLYVPPSLSQPWHRSGIFYFYAKGQLFYITSSCWLSSALNRLFQEFTFQFSCQNLYTNARQN